MVIDTSALVAILLGEPEAERLARAIAGAPRRLLSSFSAFEAALVMESRKGEAGGREFDLLLHRSAVEIVPFDEGQGRVALEAWRHYGKGRHPAGLNIGDCCAYALARQRGEPLLFKGEDFAKTDIPVAAY